MGLLIIIALAYAPIIYKINKQLGLLEERIIKLEHKIENINSKN